MLVDIDSVLHCTFQVQCYLCLCHLFNNEIEEVIEKDEHNINQTHDCMVNCILPQHFTLRLSNWNVCIVLLRFCVASFKLMPRHVGAISALLRHFFVDVSFILLVTCRCDTTGSRASFVSSQKPPAVDTNIIGHCWNTHHLTCHTVTITSTTWCKHEV